MLLALVPIDIIVAVGTKVNASPPPRRSVRPCGSGTDEVSQLACRSLAGHAQGLRLRGIRAWLAIDVMLHIAFCHGNVMGLPVE